MDTFLKDPNAVLDYTINWDDGYLEAGETISTSTWAVIPSTVGGVAIDSDTNDTTTATVTISAGKGGAWYLLENTVVTSEGRTEIRNVYVIVWWGR